MAKRVIVRVLWHTDAFSVCTFAMIWYADTLKTRIPVNSAAYVWTWKLVQGFEIGHSCCDRVVIVDTSCNGRCASKRRAQTSARKTRFRELARANLNFFIVFRLRTQYIYIRVQSSLIMLVSHHLYV